MINILGLSVGLACTIMIFLYVQYELSFDTYHTNKDRIFRITMEEEDSNGMDYNAETPFPLAPTLRAQFPEDIIITRIYYSTNDRIIIGDEKYHERHILFAEPEIFELFDFDSENGLTGSDFLELNTVLVTESLAKKYFGEEDPVNKVIHLVNIGDLIIRGVLKDPPSNTHLPYSMILNIDNLNEDFVGINYDRFTIILGGFISYARLPENMDENDLEIQMTDYMMQFLGNEADSDEHVALRLESINEIHHDLRFSTFTYLTSKKTILIIALVGILVLLIACINYINLAVTQAIKRSKEIGVRKVVGAERHKLIEQFIGESTLVTIISAVVALIIAEIFLPTLNTYLGDDIKLSVYQNPIIIIWVFLATIAIGLITGMYPALIVSGYKPLDAIKNRISSHKKSVKYLKNTLVILQFIIAQLLIIGTLVASSQLNYMKSKNLGFEKEAIINIKIPDYEQCEVLKNELRKNAGIESITFGIAGPQAILDERFETIMYLESEGRENAKTCDLKTVDLDYHTTFDFNIVAGEWMYDFRGPDSSLNVLVNEAMSRKLGFESPESAIGARTNFGRIIGVTEDFHTESLHNPIIPMVMVYFPRFFGQGYIKVHPSKMDEAIVYIEKTWSEVFPENFFSYRKYNDYISGMYSNDQRTFDILRLFAIIAIIIACMGLFGLVSYLVVQKTKEISIRKVMGATVGRIISFVTSGYLKLVIIANIVAIPVGWYLMTVWLENFAYRVNMQWWIFIVALLFSLAIAYMTVIFQTIRVARINPAEALKYE